MNEETIEERIGKGVKITGYRRRGGEAEKRA